MGERAIGVGLAIASGAAAMSVAVLGVLSQSGCFFHVCDPSTVELGGDAGQPLPAGGSLTTLPTGAVQWQSNASDGPWLDFSGQRTFVIHFPVQFAAPPTYSCLLSADAAAPQDNETQCGSLPQWSNVTATSATLFNPTCGEYGLNVLVTGVPATPPPGPLPGAVSADAGASDDASSE